MNRLLRKLTTVVSAAAVALAGVSFGALRLSALAADGDGVQTTLDVSAGNIVIGQDSVSGYDGSGNAVSEADPDGYIITGTTTEYTVTVSGTQNITLDGVNINVSETSDACAFKIEDDSTGNVTITLADGSENVLSSGYGCAGLQKNGAYSETLGKLTIKGGDNSTGKLTANGGYGSAGIGGGTSGYGSNIEITGGTVTATSGYGGGAGIGGGKRGSGSNIKISGGTVAATGGIFGAGIGGGEYGSGSSITISGGNVTATGGIEGAGIGGGERNSSFDINSGKGSNITISGGVVTATGGSSGAGIGGGSSGSGSNIIISGGSVKAVAGSDSEYVHDIGGGLGGSGAVTPTLADGTTKVFLYTIDTTDVSSVTIDGVKYPVKHGSENKIYPYLSTGNHLVTIDGAENVFYINDSGSESEPVYTTVGAFDVSGSTSAYSYSGNVLTITGEELLLIKNTAPNTATTTDRIEVADGVSAKLYLAGVKIDVSATGDIYESVAGESAFKIADNSTGDVTITLADGSENTLSGGNYCAGLQKNGAYSETLGKLIIQGSGNGTGILTATGGYFGAGIGGGESGDGSNITINGGTVNAISGSGGAGIGGGCSTAVDYTVCGSHITINGGTVNATATGGGAGIGGGSSYIGDSTGLGSYITINGGTVNATSTAGGAGIGGGHSGIGSYITINGGTVTATNTVNDTNSSGGAGIGGGFASHGSDITITGGTVTAIGGGEGAGIGGSEGNGTNIVISGGAVTATGGNKAAGIGGGWGRYIYSTGVGSNIIISGGTVTAIGGDYGAGIGGGKDGTGSNIIISGGSVNAVAGTDANAIGGGYGNSAVTPTLGDEDNTPVYLLTIANPDSEAVYIDGSETAYLPSNQTAADENDTNLYVYLTATYHEVMVGEDPVVYLFDSESGTFAAAPLQVKATNGGTLTPGTDYTYTDGVLTIKSDKAMTISGTTTTDTIVVEAGISANITLDGVNIDVSGTGDSSTLTSGSAAFKIADDSTGNVTITLADGSENTLKSGYRCAGLQKNGAYSETLGKLTIKGGANGTGKLTATGGIYGAGIGGGYYGSGSKIEIIGGTVTATGGGNGAGIGGGSGGYGSNITIIGGTVTANGGNDGAGIGGGYDGSGSNIEISGGTVTANGGKYGAGIGGGYGGSGSYITVSGGNVTATGGSYGAGIGGGYHGTGSNITISGGTVIATGGMGGAGIGGGYETFGNLITISGGTVTANGGSDGAGIGGGNDGSGSNIEITGGTVTANGGYFGAGIGGGNNGSGSNITITGGTVTATGGSHNGAGIGGGYFGTGSNITITGGTVTATGGTSGAGIGGGNNGSGSNIEITGGAVTATGGEGGAGIGGAAYNNGSYIEITGGSVKAVAGADANAIGGGYGYDAVTPTNGTDNVYLLVLDSANESLTIDGKEYPINHGTDGKVYAYLTEGEHTIIIDGDSATGNYVLSTDNLLYKHGTEFTITATDGGELIFGDDYTYTAGVLTIKSDKAITISGTTTTDTIVVEAGISANITLDGVKIDVSGTDGACAFQIEDDSTGDVTITLADGSDNVLKSGFGCAGLQKNGDYSETLGKLTIQGGTNGTGILTATGGYVGAGIGGGYGVGSNITISGGTVTATGGDYGAGIGGGYAAGSYITISGGTVTATGGENGAGIGGGNDGSGSNIEITGGTVTANGGYNSAGIGGGGYEGSGSNIEITGGAVTATGGENGAGIGGGTSGDGSNIEITGGTVTANGGYFGAGIGGGNNGSGSNITITGGTVTATGGSHNGAGIGGGYFGTGSNITITGGTVTATGGTSGAGIGGGNIGSGSNIEITGGSVNAVAGAGANAIGGGYDGGGAVTPTLGDEANTPVYLLTIENPDSEAVYIDGVSYKPVNHMAADSEDGNLYAYLTGTYHTVQVGEVTTGYYFDSTNGAFVEAGLAFSGEGLVYGTDYTYADGVFTILSHKALTISNKDKTKPTTDTIAVAYGVFANITLDGVNIDVSGTSVACAFKIEDDSTGDVTITLADGSDNVLKSGLECAGLQKNGDYSETLGKLTIQSGEKGTGKLTATGGVYGAGIGGGNGGSGSNITITGGTVTATGGYYSAGIGGGDGGSGSNIEITGGAVTANGGERAAGIGGGTNGSGSDITITGGSVNAVAGTNANAIGGGDGGNGAVTPTLGDEANTPVYLLTIANPDSAEVLIDGVSCTPVNHKAADSKDGNLYAYLIGETHLVTVGEKTYKYLFDSESSTFAVAPLVIKATNGGTLTYGTDFTYADGVLTVKSAAPITISGTTTTDTIVVEAGVCANITLDGVNIDVSGTDDACAFKIEDDSTGDVTITLADGSDNVLKSGLNCAGLQKNGAYSETLGKLTIQGGTDGTGKLTAASSKYGAGIGGSDSGYGSNITIIGGTVTATGGMGAAGIGGGYSRTGSYIEISGGNVTANGGSSGAGIGGGSKGSASDITISGGTVIANGGQNAAGIGSGYQNGTGSGITISGGVVTATGGGNGSGIGGGMLCNASDITISGGSVKAAAGIYANDIGGGNGSSGGAVTPTNEEGNNVYVLVLDSANESLVIDGKSYPINHGTDGKVYAYLTEGEHTIIIDGVSATGNYVLSTDNRIYKHGTEFTITATDGGALTYSTDYTYTGGVLTIKSDKAVTISGTTTTDTIVVEAGVSANITLDGVNIDVSGTDGACAFKIEDDSTGDVTITLADDSDNVLKSGYHCAGLQKNGDYSETLGKLTIQGGANGTGKLTANGYNGAGIGGGYDGSGSYITISGGNVTANGYNGAGIGGGYLGLGSNIEIIGGTVAATGYGGAGIGGGRNGSGSYITISGGDVTATGYGYGAGIGGGSYGSGSYITISGGNVTATGGENGAGIGGGYSYTGYTGSGDTGYTGSGSNIKISGGNVIATGGKYGAGIGGGYLGYGSNIKISGGTVTATGGDYSAGIGGGGCGSGSNITISGGSVKAVAGTNANAIGGGYGQEAVTPTLGDEANTPVYLLEIENEAGADITINGTAYPTNHNGENKIYAYLPAKTAPNAVTVGGKTTNYIYDAANAEWLIVPTVTAPTAIADLVYTGKAQALVAAGSTTHGTMVYSLSENGEYAEVIPTGINADAYTVWYKVIGENVAETTPASVEVTIAKAQISEVTISGIEAPAAGTALDADTPAANENISVAGIAWTPDDTTAAFDTVYTVNVTVTVSDSTNYRFADSVTATLNGEAATVTAGKDGSYIISFTFPKTDEVVPQNVAATAGNKTVTITWDEVEGAEKYRVQRLNGTTWATVSYPTTNSYTDTNVENGTEYSYRVLAYVDGAWSGVSEVVTATPFVNIIPQNVAATAGNKTVTITWDEVEGAEKYRVQRLNGTTWATVSYPTTNSYTDINVTNDTEYSYRVLSYVDGTWSGVSAVVTATPFANIIPQNVTATAGNKTVTLTWDEVEGAEKYRVQRLIDNVWTSIFYPIPNSYTDTDVENDTEYSYRVLAYVDGAWSGVSAVAKATPEAANIVPQNVVATAGDTTVTVTWGEVEGATKYRVQRLYGTSWVTVATPTEATYTDTDVENDTEYSYRVLSYVDGAWSGVSEVVKATPEAANIVPQNVEAIAGDSSVTLIWGAVGGAEKYRVQRLIDSTWTTVATTTEATYTDTDVENDTEYSYRVLAYVDGAWSGVSAVAKATPEAANIVPQNVEAIAGDSSVTVTWDEVEGATKYRVQRLYGTSWVTVATPTEATYTDTDVENDTEYSYRVLAYVDGAWSGVSAVAKATPEAANIIPQNVEAIAGDSSVTFIWGAVGGAEKYRVQRLIDSTWTTVATTTEATYTDTDVENDTEYSYRVLAYVDGAWSGVSAVVSATPEAANIIPQNVEAIAGDSSVTLIWGAVGGAEKYRVQRLIDSTWTTVATTTEATYTDTDVENDTEYSYRVLSYVDGAWSGVSAVAKATPNA